MPARSRFTALPALLASLAAASGLAACTADSGALPDAGSIDGGDARQIDAGPDAPVIDAGPLVGGPCGSDFDCADPATPTCGDQSVCVPPVAACQDDDAGEPDDGPSIATALDGFVNASLCSIPGESDYYRFTVDTADRVLRIHDSGSGLAIAVTSATGAAVGFDDWYPNDLRFSTPGDYVVQLFRESTPSPAAVGYTISLTEPECTTDLDCPSGEPVCAVYRCEPGPTECSDDDSYEPNDGASVAAAVPVPPMQIAAKMCWGPTDDVDWYAVELDDAYRYITLDWTDTQHLGFVLFDAALNPIAADLQFHPATAQLEPSPGLHYLAVVRMATSGTGVTPYTLRID